MLTKFWCQIRILLENKFFKECLKSLFSGKSYRNLNHLVFQKARLEIYIMHKTCPPHIKYSFWLTSSVSPLQSSDLLMALFLWSVTSSGGTGQITSRISGAFEHSWIAGSLSGRNLLVVWLETIHKRPLRVVCPPRFQLPCVEQ